MKRYIKASTDRSLILDIRIGDEDVNAEYGLVKLILNTLPNIKFNSRTLNTYERMCESYDTFADIFKVHLDYTRDDFEAGALKCRIDYGSYAVSGNVRIYGIPVNSDIDTSKLIYNDSSLMFDVDDNYNCINPSEAKSAITRYLTTEINDVAIQAMAVFRDYERNLSNDSVKRDPVSPPNKSQIRSAVIQDLRKYLGPKFKVVNIEFNDHSILNKSNLKKGNVFDGDVLWYDCEIELSNGNYGKYTADFIYNDNIWEYRTNKYGYVDAEHNWTLYDLLDQLGIEY